MSFDRAAENIDVIGTPCVQVDSEVLQARLEDWIDGFPESALSVDFTNVHIVAMRHQHEDFADTTANVDWFVPDSQVLTWAVNVLGGDKSKRVYGPDFLDYSVRNGSNKISHYFLGGNQECLDALLVNLRERRPDLNIVGSRNGYFSEDEELTIVEAIAAEKPDFLWVGLGTPKQQAFISKWKEKLPGTALLAVGFAFDVNAGTKKDAPAFLGPIGLTWLYRLCCEPTRLWKRYLKYNSIFVLQLLKQMVKN